MGSDLPDLPASIIDEAFNSLEFTDVVLGPSHDGGYYLVGFNAETFRPDIFDEMPWSTDEVLSRTLRVLARTRTTYHLLPRWRDIDEYEDLVEFIDSLKNRKQIARNTAVYLARLGMTAERNRSGHSTR